MKTKTLASLLLVCTAQVAGATDITGVPICREISATAAPGGNIGQLIPGDCATVWSALDASGQFPDVFQKSKTIPGFCFVSVNPIPALLGGNKVTLTTASAWFSDFLPAFPPNAPIGGDNMGTVATQVTIHNGNKVVGTIYTRDAIDLGGIIAGGFTAPEEDVIVGGSGRYKHVKGAYRIDTALDISGAVNITKIAGSLCTYK